MEDKRSEVFLGDKFIDDIMNIFLWLQGKKVYAMALLLALYAISGYLTHNLDLNTAMGLLWGSGVMGAFRSTLSKLES